jgi:hypothetical protein
MFKEAFLVRSDVDLLTHHGSHEREYTSDIHHSCQPGSFDSRQGKRCRD